MSPGKLTCQKSLLHCEGVNKGSKRKSHWGKQTALGGVWATPGAQIQGQEKRSRYCSTHDKEYGTGEKGQRNGTYINGT